MSAQESEMDMIRNNGDRHNGMFVHQFLRTMSKMLHAGDFYEGLPQERAHTPPVVFLLICSVIFTILSSMFELLCCRRQVYYKSRTNTFLAGCLHCSAHFIDYPVAYGKTQARSFAHRLCCKKRGEYFT